MSDFNNLKLEVAEEIAVLTIPKECAIDVAKDLVDAGIQALNSETLDELNTALTEIEAMDDVKVVILTGGPDKKGNEFDDVDDSYTGYNGLEKALRDMNAQGTFGTGVVSDSRIEAAVKAVFDLTPAGIIRDLKLNRPIYSRLARYGHFGRTELELSWEEINRKYELLSAALKQSVRQER